MRLFGVCVMDVIYCLCRFDFGATVGKNMGPVSGQIECPTSKTKFPFKRG